MTVRSPVAVPSLRGELSFLLHDWLEVEELVQRPRYAGHSRHDFDAVLELAEQVAGDLFAPHNRLADTQEPRLDPNGRVVLLPEVERALACFAETGLVGCGLDESVGGMALPRVVADAAFAFFHAANTGTTAYAMLTIAAANLISEHGSAEQRARWARPMVEGRFYGTMCLSEPHAGSSLADISTRAEPQPDGTWRLFGSKMWISGGDHEMGENIVHLVLARVPGAPSGVKGISLFLVPRYLLEPDGTRERNDVVLAGLNHKMGSRGTVNTVLGFGEGAHAPGGRAGAVGELLGEANLGLAHMFGMMNEARIGVGLGAACVGWAGYVLSVAYAQDRPQGRSPHGGDGCGGPVPIVEHADVRRMLLAQKSYVEGALALALYCGRLVDEQRSAPNAEDREGARLLLDLLTPIAKSWPAQWCLAANDLAIQVHGGYGYAREYDVEQLYRDNRLNAIHEGTHGIQALDLLGRKASMAGGAALGALATRIRATVERAHALGGEPADHAEQLDLSLGRLLDVTALLTKHPDRHVALANASLYLEATGHLVVAWLWLEQTLAVSEGGSHRASGKRQAARYFFAYELPRTGAQWDLLASLDRTTLNLDPAWL